MTSPTKTAKPRAGNTPVCTIRLPKELHSVLRELKARGVLVPYLEEQARLLKK